jgi:hypothetical protein
MAWTNLDQMTAMQEGWMIFEDANGHRIQAWDGPQAQQRLTSDEAAVAFVAFRATIGDNLANKAIHHLARTNKVMEAAITFHVKPPRKA